MAPLCTELLTMSATRAITHTHMSSMQPQQQQGVQRVDLPTRSPHTRALDGVALGTGDSQLRLLLGATSRQARASEQQEMEERLRDEIDRLQMEVDCLAEMQQQQEQREAELVASEPRQYNYSSIMMQQQQQQEEDTDDDDDEQEMEDTEELLMMELEELLERFIKEKQ